MMTNGKEFAQAKSEFAAREDYSDRWLACVAQWRRILRQLSLSDLVAVYGGAQQIAGYVAKLRTRVTLHYGPSGDHELIDMIVQLQERLEAYEIEARNAMQACALTPSIYKDDPSAFLRAVLRDDEPVFEEHTIDLDRLREMRAQERAQWEAERPDWKAPDYEDDET